MMRRVLAFRQQRFPEIMRLIGFFADGAPRHAVHLLLQGAAKWFLLEWRFLEMGTGLDFPSSLWVGKGHLDWHASVKPFTSSHVWDRDQGPAERHSFWWSVEWFSPQ